MDHIRLLMELGELNWVFKESFDVKTLLNNVVSVIARHMKVDVCSIYFYDESRNELVLRACVGVNKVFVGKVRMKLGEGIVGTSLEKLEPICTDDIISHPLFKPLSGLNEESYKAIMAVPIISGSSRVGVLVLQRKVKSLCDMTEVRIMQVIASRLAALMENVKLMTSIKHELNIEKDNNIKPVFETKFLKGKPASRGYAYAPVYVIQENTGFKYLKEVEFKRYSLKDFNEALNDTELQIKALRKQVAKNLVDAASMIFTSHLLMLKDRSFIEGIIENIKKGKNPPEAVMLVAKKYMDSFLASTNEYMKEKSKDVEDLAVRIISNMVKREMKLPGVKGRIVIAREMFPSDVLKLSGENVKGVVLISGGISSHVSILSRSLSIPMVIVNEPALLNIDRDARVLLDAELGNIYINPLKEVLSEFKDKLENVSKKTNIKMLPETLTADGLKIQMMANVNLLKDLDTIKELSCDGIGLYRSEFPFLIRNNFPSEEEQYFVYRKLVEGMPGKEITFRTLDIGGDKVLSYSQGPKKENPFLGLRSIRFSLKNKGIFVDQIKAILRAGDKANLRIMFPMIFSIEEFIKAKDIVKECSEVLEKQGVAHNRDPKIGMMVEIPAVISIIEDFAKISDFFSIGTNDLVQYMLAVDRTNEEVADYYLPHHPSILRGIKRVTDAAIKNNIDVSVCGDMSNSAKYISFLIGIGIKKLSMNPGYLYENQKVISSLTYKDSKIMADKLLEYSRMADIEKLLFS